MYASSAKSVEHEVSAKVDKFGHEIGRSASLGKRVYANLSVASLVEAALQDGEGQLTAAGALAVQTGHHTGRSAGDKFIVRDVETADRVWWQNNAALSPENFERLYQDFIDHAAELPLYAQDLYAGRDETHRLPVRVYCEYAWHSLFIGHLLTRPADAELEGFAADLTIIDLPSFKADPMRHGVRSDTVIACDFSRGLVLIGGTSYAGEIKKSVFTYLNYTLPQEGVMPMHCSANVGEGGDSAVFFGLSGTGKTTLSADARRTLIGDDEHGWSANGVFNFEGGCYAKTVNLSADAEPQIYAAAQSFASVLENVVVDATTRQADFDDTSLTENTRCAYPINYISNASPQGTAPHPKAIIMLTADAFGVMPPIARLSPQQAVYHFLSGYTAKVAGTEKGMGDTPSATFSTCFGAPFMPCHPRLYGDLLQQLVEAHDAECWLVNTGWTGGAHGVGNRMPLAVTRRLLAAALDGELNGVPMRPDPYFGFDVPVEVSGIDRKLLDPRGTWSDRDAYDAQAARLVSMFNENFVQFAADVDAEILQGGPVASSG